jgi:addiction module RelE/StbE family toxin
MKYRVEYLSTFHADIRSVAAYLAEFPKKASRIFAKLDEALKALEQMPELHPVYHDIPSFRFLVVEEYLVFYKVMKRSGTVEIHRLLNGRMDIPAKVRDE